MRYYEYYSDSTLEFVIACVCVGGVVALIGAGVGCSIYDDNIAKKNLEQINKKVEIDLNVDSFSTQSVVFDKTNENFVIKIVGFSKKEDYVAANYKVSEQDFYKLKSDKNDVASVDRRDHEFIKNILEILNCSEFLGQETEKLALTSRDEIILNLSKPYLDQETNSINYNLTIAKLQNRDLKLGTFVVSAPLDEGLRENPKEIYSKPAKEVKIEKVETKTYKDVLHVEMHDDYTLVV